MKDYTYTGSGGMADVYLVWNAFRLYHAVKDQTRSVRNI